jgi:outer membrane protein TolC
VRQAEAEVREREAVQAQARLDVLREVGDALARVRATETLVRRYDQTFCRKARTC